MKNQSEPQIPEFEFTDKQLEALDYLEDPIVEEALFGGGAGGGKTHFGCSWLLMNASRYPGSRWLIGRSELKKLKQTTMKTMFKLFSDKGLHKDIDFHYNKQDGEIYFANGSEFILADLKLQPSDPEFDSLGSYEYTGGFIDEAQEITFKAYEVITTRLRYMTADFGIPGRLLMSCNPGKNFLYSHFYKPSITGKLAYHRAFIQALVTDNPHADPGYIKKLQRSSEATKQRLLFGNWDFSDEDNQLIPYHWLQAVYVKDYPKKIGDAPFIRKIGFDVAREGGDNSILSLWLNNVLVDMKIVKIKITSQTDIGDVLADELIKYARSNGTGYQDCTIDAVGVGASVVDACRRKGFYVNEYKGGQAMKTKSGKKIKTGVNEFANLRVYSHWSLRKGIQTQQLKIWSQCPHLEHLERDIGVYTYQDNDKVILLEKKETIKQKLGRSPDFLDSVVMAIAPKPSTRWLWASNR